MTTITKERIELFIKNPLENGLTRGEQMEVARIALASLEAEPVAYMVGTQLLENMTQAIAYKADTALQIKPLYTAPSAPVSVPDLKPVGFLFVSDDGAVAYSPAGWPMKGFNLIGPIYGDVNACRAAMLHGAEPVSQTYKSNELSGNSPGTPDSWISCSDRMPNDKQYVWCWGKSYGWTECNTFEGYYDWSRNKWWAVTDDGEEPASKVTHWMPLPEPPEQDGE